MEKLERNDIQGIILSAYGHLPCAAYLLLRIDDLGLARGWITRMADTVTNAVAKQEDFSVNLALTCEGLQKLGLPESALESFPIAFRDGMNSAKRSHILGDTGDNLPDAWNWGNGDHIHLMLMVFGREETVLEVQLRAFKESTTAGGLSLVKALSAGRQPDTKEHFGFADGIAQPVIDGNERHGIKQMARTGHATVIKAGEFILGYINEYDIFPASPTVDAHTDRRGVLRAYEMPEDLRLATHREGQSLRDLGRNGSYLVFRQLEQDVPDFWHFLDEATQRNGQSDEAERIRLGAKFVGRWPSGAALVKSPERDDDALKDDNDFGYAETDRHGFACPIGSHIRRCNPRDSLGDDPADSIAAVKRHRLLRRGRSYGDRIENPLVADGKERGLHFICLNTDLERQFEFVQQTWVNNTVFGGLDQETDPLIGNQDVKFSGQMMTVQADPLRVRVPNLRSFVTVKGGAYFFLPGISALHYLGSLQD